MDARIDNRLGFVNDEIIKKIEFSGITPETSSFFRYYEILDEASTYQGMTMRVNLKIPAIQTSFPKIRRLPAPQ